MEPDSLELSDANEERLTALADIADALGNDDLSFARFAPPRLQPLHNCVTIFT